MAETRTGVRTVMVRLMCDKCGEGEMKPTGIQLLSNPPQYPHACNKCGAETTIRGGKTYPRIEYEEVTPNALAQGREPHRGEASPGATGSTTPGNHGEKA